MTIVFLLLCDLFANTLIKDSVYENTLFNRACNLVILFGHVQHFFVCAVGFYRCKKWTDDLVDSIACDGKASNSCSWYGYAKLERGQDQAHRFLSIMYGSQHTRRHAKLKTGRLIEKVSMLRTLLSNSDS